MNSQKDRAFARSLLAVGALALLSVLPFGAARAADPIYVMKITSPTINDVPDTYARYFAAAVEKDSGGRIKGEVYPASQLGSIPRQIEGTQFGAIQMAVMPPEFFVGIDERFEVLAAPGLVNSIEQGQKLTADPAVRKMYLSLRCRKRAARRRTVHVGAVRRDRQESRSAISPISKARSFGPSPRNSRPRHFPGSARRRW